MSSINNKSKSFMLYKEWEEIFLALESDAERGELIREIFAFTRTGEEPDLKGAMKIAFMVMSNQLRRDAERYKKVCDRNQKNIAKRWDSEDDTKKYESIPEDTKNTDKEKDEEKEIDTDKEKGEDIQHSAMQKQYLPDLSPAPEKQKYGEFENVSLSCEEYERLADRFGRDMTDRCIESMDAYIEQSGKEYRSCYAKLKNWISEESVKTGNTPSSKASSAENGKLTEQELADYESYARAHSMEDFARELEERSTILFGAEQQ
ncbi:MAG: hypothetical protein J6Z29_01905 [Ruminococcus sp.]|nr:hypothetical protein [Ruminococcus sp.]